MDKLILAHLFVLILQISKHSILSLKACPADCICYTEYLSNLASWKWVENDIAIQKDDLDHKDFNPYTEHNEVMDNPTSQKLRLQEGRLQTVTCILRKNDSKEIYQTLQKVSSSTQILSLMQAPGSGVLTLEKQHLENLNYLVGLEVQGYSAQYYNNNNNKDKTSFNIQADAFLNLKKLTYLNLENVQLLQRNVENEIHGSLTRLLRINYTMDGSEISNDIGSQLLLMTPPANKEKNEIIPYSQYKTEMKENNGLLNQNPVEPKIAVCFTGLPNLNHLRISGCNLQDISWDMFSKLNNLKFLLLESNDLLFLPDFVFYATTNLTALSLARNRILNLHTVGLAGLLHLQKLDVSNNNITHLSELSLPPFPHLEIADFRFNPIEAIFPNTFEVMNTTKTLYLGDPSIYLEFFPNSFFGLISLTRLDLINVRIAFLERPMLKGMPKLQSMTMEGIVRKISYDAFSEVPKLEKLILKKCSIMKISMDAFYGLHSLIELDLSQNDLTFLPPGLFDEQLSLREISLNHNKLNTLPVDLFRNIPAKMIRLDANPWHCSCDMLFWDSAVVSQIKRLYIHRNDTYCQRHYDKGSMCDNGTLPSFKVKYVYEKRVTPLCKTPTKFAQKDVFVVLRKELQHCTLQSNTTVSRKTTPLSEILNSTPIPAKLDKTSNESTTSAPTKTTLKISKKAQLLMARLGLLNTTHAEPKRDIEGLTPYTLKPTKVTKPTTTLTTGRVIRLEDNNFTVGTNIPTVSSAKISTAYPVTVPTSHINESVQREILNSTTSSSTKKELKLDTDITISSSPVLNNYLQFVTEPPTTTTTTTTTIAHRQRPRTNPKPTKPARMSNNIPRILDNNIQTNRTNGISRKALKLAKMLRSQRTG